MRNTQAQFFSYWTMMTLMQVKRILFISSILREDENGGEDDDGDNDDENDVDDEDDDARGENSLDTLHSIRYYQLLLAPGKH